MEYSNLLKYKKILALVLTLGVVSCVHKLRSPEELTVKTWSSEKEATRYPERNLPFFNMREDIGIAFSGGGTRSAACVAGQLRGLQHIGVLKRVRYISSVSGGSWGVAPYVFFNPDLANGVKYKFEKRRFKIVDDAELLGSYRHPTELKGEDFGDENNDNNGGYITKAISKSTITIPMLFSGSGDENFATALNKTFLTPFGLGDRNCFVSFNAKTRDEVRNRNLKSGSEISKFKVKDFYISERKPGSRPFWIANAYLTTKRSEPETLKRFYPIEMTPYYVGSRRSGPSYENLRFGGGFVETAGYDSINCHAVSENLRRVKISQKRFLPSRLLFPEEPRFSISDILAASGSAPMNKQWVSRAFADMGFPEFNHWPINNAKLKGGEFLHNDGGAVDNLGIAPLLARKVKTIYAFCNSPTPFLPVTSKAGMKADKDCKPRVNEMIASLFRVRSPKQSKENKSPKNPKEIWKNENIMFENVINPRTGMTPYSELVAGLDRSYKACEPLVFSGTYRTVDNPLFGINGGHEVRVVWFVLGGAGNDFPHKFISKLLPKRAVGNKLNPWIARTRWYNNLPAETKNYLVRKSATVGQSRALRMFPYYGTFLSNKGRMIDLSRVQAEALAHYTAYAVVESEDVLK